jgi:hypothetical protein
MLSFKPQPHYPQSNRPQYPLDRRLDGPQSRSGRGGQEKKIPSLSLSGIEPRSSNPWPRLYTDLVADHCLYKFKYIKTQTLIVNASFLNYNYYLLEFHYEYSAPALKSGTQVLEFVSLFLMHLCTDVGHPGSW